MMQALQMFAATNPGALVTIIGLAALCTIGLIADVWEKRR